jgi:hypothetical protein
MKNISREIAHPAYPYCPQHNRLLPHPVVGWLTPAYPEKLPTVQVRCDRCKVEERSCPSSVRVNTRGMSSDRHKDKKA